MSQKRYLSATKACYKAYEQGGVQAAINEAEKRGYTTLKYCSPCEAEQPMIEERIRDKRGKIVTVCDCAVCGTSAYNI